MERITFEITNENKKKIKERAEFVGLSMAGFCRHTILREILREDFHE